MVPSWRPQGTSKPPVLHGSFTVKKLVHGPEDLWLFDSASAAPWVLMKVPKNVLAPRRSPNDLLARMQFGRFSDGAITVTKNFQNGVNDR